MNKNFWPFSPKLDLPTNRYKNMLQKQLFDTSTPYKLPLKEADVVYFPTLFTKEKSDLLLEQLQHNIKWEQKKIKIFGKELDQPRLTAFYGDSALPYTYSNLTWYALPWTPLLAEIKKEVEHFCDTHFTSVLLNLYRAGGDSMGWHSDDEPELGENPIIASVSFGAARKFSFRHRKEKQRKFDLELTHGSLLLMKGATQANWQHQLPKTKKVEAPRVNLTFRIIQNI